MTNSEMDVLFQVSAFICLGGMVMSWVSHKRGPSKIKSTRPSTHTRQSVPDEESRSARWVTRAELLRLPLRSQELLQWIDYLEAGGVVHPLSLFAGEHEPVPVLVPDKR